MPRKKKEETGLVKPKAAKPKAVKSKTVKAKTTVKKATVKVVTPKKPAVKVSKPKAKKPAASPARKTRPPMLDVEALSKKHLKKMPTAKTEPLLVAASAFKPLPRHGENQLVAFVRDPQCVFTYWEITPERLEEVKRELQDEFKGSFMVLRLYKVDAQGDRFLVKEIHVEPEQINHYVDIEEQGGTYVFEIARKTVSGRVVAYVSSRPVATGPLALDGFDPTSSPLDVSDPIRSAEGFEAYYAEQGYEDPHSFMGNSSAQNALRKQRAHWTSSH